VRDSRCGLAVDSGDPARIAAAVAALADPATRAALGANGRAAAATRYAWEGEAARLVALYERLSPSTPRRPAGAAASGGG
jgi:glycosyltransferase involved in cell wall biosynthesis